MDISSAGALDGLKNAAKVVVYIAVSGALTALISYFKPLETNEWGFVYATINTGLAFLKTWLTTKMK